MHIFLIPNLGAYGASKTAVQSIGQTLQVELMGTGVSCTTMHPGFVVSEIARIDNDGVWHPERPDPRPSNLMWPTDKAAKVMVKAILKRKRNYIFTGHGKAFVWLQRWFPGVMRRIISKSPNQMPDKAKPTSQHWFCILSGEVLKFRCSFSIQLQCWFHSFVP